MSVNPSCIHAEFQSCCLGRIHNSQDLQRRFSRHPWLGSILEFSCFGCLDLAPRRKVVADCIQNGRIIDHFKLIFALKVS